MWRICSPRTWECQKPSGLRPEGCCHSILFQLGVRLHGECQNVGALVHLLACGLQLFASLQVRSLGPSGAEGSHHERHAVDGLPCGNRYRRACLGKSVLFPRHTPPRAGPRPGHFGLRSALLSTPQCPYGSALPSPPHLFQELECSTAHTGSTATSRGEDTRARCPIWFRVTRRWSPGRHGPLTRSRGHHPAPRSDHWH